MHTDNDPLTLRSLQREIPKECMTPPFWRNLIFFAIKFTICVGAFFLACYSENWLATIALTIVSGVFAFALGTVGHDCGHNAYLRPHWLNELVGQMCLIFNALPYTGWKHFHDTHHKNTNCCEDDPDRNWIYYDEYMALSSVEKFFWRFFLTKGFMFISIPHYFKVMLPWSFLIHKKTQNPSIRRAAYRDVVLTLLILVSLHSLMFVQLDGSLKSVLVHACVVTLSLMGLSLYVRTQHYHLPSGHEYANQPWITSRTVVQPWIFDFFANNLNYHVEHHILSSVPHANLPSLRSKMKKLIEDKGQTYHEMRISEVFNFFKTPFMVMDKFDMKEKTIKEIESTPISV